MPLHPRRIFSLLPAAVIALQQCPVVAQIINQQTLEAANQNAQAEEEGTIPGLYYDPSGVVAPTFANSPASETAGSIRIPAGSQAPSYLNGAWPANASSDQVLKIGHLKHHPQFKQFTDLNINQVLKASGKDPATVKLSEVPIASSMTVGEYLQINPDAAEQSLEEAPAVVQSAFGYYEDEPLLNEPIDQTDITFIEQKSTNPEISDIPAEDLLEGDWGDAFTEEEQSKLAKTLSKVNERLRKLPLKQLLPLTQGIINGDWDTVKKQAKDLAIKEGSKILIKELMKNPKIAKAIKDLPLGTLPLDKLGLADAPGVGETAIQNIPGAEDKTLNQIPGLKDVPLDQIDLALALSFTRLDLLGRIDTTDAASVVDNIDHVISGGTKDQIPKPAPCKIDGKDTKNCRHIELDNVDGGGEPTKLSGMGWIQGPDQMVPGGQGWLRIVANGKEVTGIKPWIAGPVKLYLEDMKEGSGDEVGSARLSTAWQFCHKDPITGLHCTPHFIRVPTPWRIKEGGIMLLLARSGGIPDAIRNLQPSQQQFCVNPEIAKAVGSAPTSDDETQYGHHAYEDTKDDLYQVTSVDGVNEGLNKDAAEAFEKMREDAATQGLDIRAVSSHRSVADQQKLWENQVKKQGSEAAAAKISAPPGHSEHHTGLAVDVGNNQNPYLNKTWANTSEYQWMQENAGRYGYELSFPEDGSGAAGFEPWHWRYVGSEEAKQTFASVRNSGTLTGTEQQDAKPSQPNNPDKNIQQYLARIALGESSGGTNIGPHPDTGAYGEYQFIKPTRNTILARHGIDAWSTDKSQRDRAALHLIEDFSGEVGEDIMGHIRGGDFARADALLGRHVYDGRGKVIRYGQFTSLPGGAEESAYWKNPETLEQYGPTGDAGTNAPLIASNGALGCGSVGAGNVATGPEGDGVSTGRFISPVNRGIDSPFGQRWGKLHAGTDHFVPIGTPIKAADGGVVIDVENGCPLNGYYGSRCGGGFGNLVFVKHKDGSVTRYAHLQQANVKIGQKVSQGQQIATSGNSGSSYGPHLHFEIRAANGQPLNPANHI
ncbi:D-alanyl-D-alanine carboxypeptidase family protein [Acaryochloris marina NIES-2412]|uniref:D-alanyl-D-alanine carboxypeptidase family protein n=1 Tax=Acaryochloris marina TaxID=155978 RepID=UPI004058FBA8